MKKEIESSTITGWGESKQEAAEAFLENFKNMFPKTKGEYVLVIRAPFEFLEQRDYMRKMSEYQYRMRISYLLTKEYKELDFIGLSKDV